jgi:hypothetical protein
MKTTVHPVVKLGEDDIQRGNVVTHCYSSRRRRLFFPVLARPPLDVLFATGQLYLMAGNDHLRRKPRLPAANRCAAHQKTMCKQANASLKGWQCTTPRDQVNDNGKGR